MLYDEFTDVIATKGDYQFSRKRCKIGVIDQLGAENAKLAVDDIVWSSLH